MIYRSGFLSCFSTVVVLLKMAISFLKFRKTFFYVLITVFTAALSILAFKTRFVIVGFNSESGWRRILQPKEQKTPILSRGYVLSYRFWDQTSGVVNVMSLQCWAEMMNMRVPEHFLIGAEIGLPESLVENGSLKFGMEVVRMSDMFDEELWKNYSHGHHFSTLVKWEDFLHTAPRKVVMVYLVYPSGNSKWYGSVPECSPKELNKYKGFNVSGFEVVRNVCIYTKNYRGRPWKEFNSAVLGEYTSDVTVVISLWRGLGEPYDRLAFNLPACYRKIHSEYHKFAQPTMKIRHETQLYINTYLKRQNYIAVMIRFERVTKKLVGRFNVKKCVRVVMKLYHETARLHNITSTFWSFDFGQFGSHFAIIHPEKVDGDELQAEFLNSYSVNYNEVELRLVNVSGTLNNAYIASLQRNIVTEAKCVILLGGGSYHGYALKMFRSKHPGNFCYMQKEAEWLIAQCSK